MSQAKAQLEAARAQFTSYDAQLAQARRDLERAKELVSRRLVSQQAFETTRTQVETLSAQVEFQLKQVELAHAAVQAALVQLSYTTVRAPFSGVVVAKAAQAGEIVSPVSAGGGFTRTGVGTLVDMHSLEIEVDVNESYITRVRSGQSAQAVLDAYSNWEIPAHVIAVVPAADAPMLVFLTFWAMFARAGVVDRVACVDARRPAGRVDSTGWHCDHTQARRSIRCDRSRTCGSRRGARRRLK